jgi:hypothetical protein
VIFSRKNDESSTSPDLSGSSPDLSGDSGSREETPKGYTAKKGRPTPTRRESEAANRRPLVVEDRKAAKREDRARSRAANDRAQQAMLTGEEANMPAQHRGPQRRFVRDVVYSRRNVAEFFFPAALVLMVIALVMPFFSASLYSVASIVLLVMLWGGIIGCVIDGFILRNRLKKVVPERFGDMQGGLVWYGVMRALQIRRWRLPRPMIDRGRSPR